MSKTSDQYFDEVAELIRSADITYSASEETVRTLYATSVPGST